MGLMRRRGLLGESEPNWDIEWDYTMGLPTADNVFRKSSSKSSDTLQSDAVSILVQNSAGAALSYLYDGSFTKQIIEVRFKTGANNGYMCTVNTSDGSKGIGVLFFNQVIRLRTSSSIAKGRQIGTYSHNTEHTVRIVMENGYGDVYVDGALLASNESVSNFDNVGITRAFAVARQANGTQYTALLYSIKMLAVAST